jgi:hypothetical protein
MITTQVLTSGKVYKKESEGIKCPVCGKSVDYLLGDDEGSDKPDAGRMGCEDCWRPFKYSKQSAPLIGEPTNQINELDDGKISAKDLIKELGGL